ncbi:hypothetical protein WN51_13368 [Melipona quadrifasciata]|uniref:Uncharacterized protein n=1 Tax=Melipona quadrifasciata TaxID=166423 RepID=A0A0N0BGN4_9HYME|nr:hypothetical protein WN51_13368 [Melipona quadrifasciata]
MMETQNYWEDNSAHSMQVKYESSKQTLTLLSSIRADKAVADASDRKRRRDDGNTFRDFAPRKITWLDNGNNGFQLMVCMSFGQLRLNENNWGNNKLKN